MVKVTYMGKLVWHEFVRKLKNIQVFLVLAMVSVLCSLVSQELYKIAIAIGKPNYIGDTFLVMNNNMYIHLCLVIAILFINSKLSSINESQYMVLIRIGKKNWLMTKLIVACLNVLLYFLFVLFITIVFSARFSYIENYWSTFFRGGAMKLEYIINQEVPVTFPLSLINGISVRDAMMHTYLFMTLYCMSLSVIMITLNVRYKTNIGFIVALIIHFIGWIISYLPESMLVYISPMNHSLLNNHNFGAVNSLSFVVSYIFFIVIAIAMIILSMKSIKKSEF